MSQFFLPNAVLRGLAKAIFNRAFTTGALAESATALKFKTTATVTYIINGVFKAKTATDNLVFTSGHASVNPDVDTAQQCKFLVTLDGSGNVKTIQSAIVAASASEPDLPAVPSGECPIGYIKVVTTAGYAFIPNTTDLSDTGITATFVDLSWVDSGDDSFSY